MPPRCVLIGDVPLDEAGIKAWRNSIGYAPQNPLLFHGTNYNNVVPGDESPGRSAVEEALQLAGAWPMVAALPESGSTTSLSSGADISRGVRGNVLRLHEHLSTPRVY